MADGEAADSRADSGLKAVFLATRPQLLRLLVARLGSVQDAEDALQDLWLRLDALAGPPIAQPAAFLYRMAANLATDRRIAQQRRTVRDTAWLDVQPAADEIPNAERTLIARERLATLEAAIRDMPDRMRLALRMFRFEGRSQKAIAAELGITVSGVEKLLKRAYRVILANIDTLDADMPDPCRLHDERRDR